MTIHTLLSEIRFYLFQLRQNFNNKRTLRTSFAIQVVSMMLGNLSFFIIWHYFTKAVGTHNGWGTLQTFGMISTSVMVFGIVHTGCGGLYRWYELIPGGAFDVFLNKPKQLYLRILNSDFQVGALGDVIQGALGVIIFLCLAKPAFVSVLMFVLLLVPAITIHMSFLFICNCIIFWLPQGGSLPTSLGNLILLPATQPISLLGGAMRFVYLFVFPALLIAGLPIENLIHSSWKTVFLAYGIAGFWLWLSVFVLKMSVRRYESGNSIGA